MQPTILRPQQINDVFSSIISTHIEPERIQLFIREAEYIHVKPRLRDAMYLDIINTINNTSPENYTTEFKTLLNGGVFETDKRNNIRIIDTFDDTFDYTFRFEQEDCSPTARIFHGLLLPIAYYTYSKLVMLNDVNITRFGSSFKDDENSTRIGIKEKLLQEKNKLSVADMMLDDCILFISSNCDKFPKFKKAGKPRSRMPFTVIH